MWINRGVAYWRDRRRRRAPCAARVFLATLDARLIALDAATGKPCADFGASGTVNLLDGHRAALRRARVQRHLAGHRGRRRDRRGLLDRRHAAPRCAARRRARLRRAHGRAALDVPHDSARGRGRARDLGDRHARSRAPRTCGRRSPPTSRAAGVPARQHAEPRLLRRRPRRREPVQRLGRRARRRDRDAHLALPDRAPRSLGLRPRRAARARDARARRRAASTRSCRRRSTASCSCSTARPARRCSRSRSGRCPRATCRASARGRRSRCRRAPPPLVPQRLDRGRSLRADARASRARAASGSPSCATTGLFTPPSLRGSIALSVHGRRRELVGRELRSRAPAAGRAGAEPRARRARSTRSRERATGGGSDVRPLQRHRASRNLCGCSRAAAPATATACIRSAAARCSQHDGVPCNRPPWGRLVAVDLARGDDRVERVDEHARRRSGQLRATGPRSRPRAASSSTAARALPVLRVHDVAHRRADRDLRAARRPARGPDQLQARARRQAVPRRRAGRPRRRRLAARRLRDRLHAAVNGLPAIHCSEDAPV